MRERLLEGLPGYTGPNVLARGKDIEADAVWAAALSSALDRGPRSCTCGCCQSISTPARAITRGLTYDSPALDPYRQQRSPLQAFDGKWPIGVDPRELHRVWFQDPRDQRFHELRWRHAREVQRPFGASALAYVKRLLVESGMRRPSEEEIATGLARLLHELSDEDLFRDRRARREAVRQAVITEQRRAQAPAPTKPPAAAPPKFDAWSGIEIPTLELER